LSSWATVELVGDAGGEAADHGQLLGDVELPAQVAVTAAQAAVLECLLRHDEQLLRGGWPLEDVEGPVLHHADDFRHLRLGADHDDDRVGIRGAQEAGQGRAGHVPVGDDDGGRILRVGLQGLVGRSGHAHAESRLTQNAGQMFPLRLLMRDDENSFRVAPAHRKP
jgi:hypothetical protein